MHQGIHSSSDIEWWQSDINKSSEDPLTGLPKIALLDLYWPSEDVITGLPKYLCLTCTGQAKIHSRWRPNYWPSKNSSARPVLAKWIRHYWFSKISLLDLYWPNQNAGKEQKVNEFGCSAGFMPLVPNIPHQNFEKKEKSLGSAISFLKRKTRLVNSYTGVTAHVRMLLQLDLHTQPQECHCQPSTVMLFFFPPVFVSSQLE